MKKLSLLEAMSHNEVRKLANQIFQRWQGNPRMIMKAAQAAANAAQGLPQEIFPDGLALGPQAYIELSEILKNNL